MAYDPLMPVMKRDEYEEWEDLKFATERDRRGAFKYSWLPKPSGKKKLYVIGLKQDCPRKHLSIFGITFEKEIFSPVTEPGVLPEPVQAVVELADNQVEAIKKRAGVLEVEYLEVKQNPHPMNPNFMVTESGEYKKFCPADYLIIREIPISKWDKTVISMYELNDLMAKAMEEKAMASEEPKSKESSKKGK